MMDLNEIRNRITELLYRTTAPQSLVWAEIQKIEMQYLAEIKQIQEERDLVFDDLMACKTQIEEARSALAADDNETLGQAAEHILAAARKAALKFNVKPEVIDWSQLTKKHRLDEDSPEAWADFIIVATMTKKCPRGEFHELFDLMERPTDRLEIVLTINDVQVPFMKTIQRFHQVVEDRVQSRLEEVLNDRFGKLDDFLDEVRDTIHRAAKEKLGLKIEVEEEDR